MSPAPKPIWLYYKNNVCGIENDTWVLFMSVVLIFILAAFLFSGLFVVFGLALYRLLLVRFPSRNEKSDDIITYPMV
jgi:hypothetical protein